MKELPATTPKVRKLNLYFSTGLHVTARAGSISKHGVTVYDVLTAIYKMYKKKVPTSLINPPMACVE